MQIAAIPTMYKGIQMRSRLEAKWAAVFDVLGWKWTYEPYDLNGWIPDFVLHLSTPTLVEIKPSVLIDELEQHTGKINAANPVSDVLLVGASLFRHPAFHWLGTVGLLRSFRDDGSCCAHKDYIDKHTRGRPILSTTDPDALGFVNREYGGLSWRTAPPNWLDPSVTFERFSEAFTLASNQTQWRSPRKTG